MSQISFDTQFALTYLSALLELFIRNNFCFAESKSNMWKFEIKIFFYSDANEGGKN